MAVTTRSDQAEKNREASPAPFVPGKGVKKEIEEEIEPISTEADLLPWNGACDLPSGEPLGRPSTYDTAASGFKLTVNVQDDVSFCLKQYKIASGPMKGFRALVLVPAGSFRLLDLPLEIRHMIYSYLVTREDPIKLKRYQGRLVQQTFAHGTVKSAGWDAEHKKWNNRDKNLLGIGGVNRQIHNEAAEVVYKTNRFIFEDPQTFSLLAKLSGARVRHLRNVDIDTPKGGTGIHLAAALNVFKNCTSLRTLRLPHSAICTTASTWNHRTKAIVSVEALVEACAPMLFALEKSRQKTRFTQSVLDVITCIQCECGACKLRAKDPTFAHGCSQCYCKDHDQLQDLNEKLWGDFKRMAGIRLAGKIMSKKSGTLHRTLDSLWASPQKK